jgi:microcystin-dependent protein
MHQALMTRRTLALSCLALTALCMGPAQAQSVPYIGQIACSGSNFAPIGWLPAEGQLLSIAEYDTLFSLIGTQYGGDGVSNFALPDLRGRIVIGQGQAPGRSNHVLGESSGTESTTLSVKNIPPHAHTVAPLGSSGDATDVSPAGKAPATKARTALYGNPTPGTNLEAAVTSSAGSGKPVPTLAPYEVVTCAIATEGIYPSRP